MRLVLLLVVAYLLISGCTSPPYGTFMPVRNVDDYPGIDSSAGGFISVDRQTDSVIVRLEQQPLIEVRGIPSDWVWRVSAVHRLVDADKSYHWAVLEWESSGGQRRQLVVEYLGEDNFFAEFDGELLDEAPGCTYVYRATSNSLVAQTEG